MAGEPARGYSWRIFTSDDQPIGQPSEAGHERSLKHGAHSKRAIERHRSGIHAEVLAAAPWTAAPEFEHAVLRYERAEIRARLLHQHLSAIAQSDGGVENVPNDVWKNLHAAERLAAHLAARLGLDPMGRAMLAKDTAMAGYFGQNVDLALFWAAEDAAEAAVDASSKPAGLAAPGGAEAGAEAAEDRSEEE